MFRILICVLLLVSQSACSARMRTIATASAIGMALGAGLGYTVLHHGAHKQYQVQNTIIGASVLGAGFGIATWYHLNALDEQKMELAGHFSRATYLDRDVDKNSGTPLTLINLGKHSVKLDSDTRWVLPEFQKRLLPPERNENEIVASHHSWEIVRPGFFLTKDQDPSLFKEEEKK